MNETNSTSRIAEVVSACTTEFVAQCYELYDLPPLGSLVKTRDASMELYGVVYNAATTGVEPGRHPIARGKDEASEEAIYKSSPQLLKLLRSEFSAVVIGYKQDGHVYQHLPPKPARIHSFVYQCTPDEVKQFSQSFDFLNILVKARLPISVEELVGACLRQMSLAYEADRRAFLVAAGKELATLLAGDFSQLKSLLRGLKHDAG